MTLRRPPDTIRVFVAGNSGTGKSALAWHFYAARFPRRLIVDPTGEWAHVSDADALSVEEAVRAVRRLAPRGRWTVSLGLDDDDELRDFVDWLLPLPTLEESPVLAMGGAVLLIDEVDLLAPMGPPIREVRTLYRRSRHVGLSVISTTSGPSNVSREVSRQSTQAVAFRLSEPVDREYMVKLMRWGPAELLRWEEWVQYHPHGAVWRALPAGETRLLEPISGRLPAWRLSPLAPSATPAIEPE